jgi:hypothetical protein
MIGRLFEVSKQNAELLLQNIKNNCDHILAYVYPGWSIETFSNLLKKFDLKIIEKEGAYAGIVE